MINLLVGAPGGGKSYEATVFHILKAVSNGRRVITNLPLNVEYFDAIEPGAGDLIVLRGDTLDRRAFSTLEEFGDPWRHPESGAGPLYVIDECHRCLPAKETPRVVEEWFAEHRHERADVLLLTQSYGKCSKAIIDLVQIVYRVRKNVALGSSGSYTRKVQDGIRGAVMNTAIRRYNPKFFSLYTSHTKSSEYGSELCASDVRPLYLHWSVLGAGACLLFVIFAGFKGWLNPFGMVPEAAATVGSEDKPYEISQPAPVVVRPVPKTAAGAVSVKPQSIEPKPAPEVAEPDLPFGALTFQVIATVTSAERREIWFHALQASQPRFQLSASDLREAGYSIQELAPCAVRLRFGAWSRIVTCAGTPLRVEIPGPL